MNWMGLTVWPFDQTSPAAGFLWSIGGHFFSGSPCGHVDGWPWMTSGWRASCKDCTSWESTSTSEARRRLITTRQPHFKRFFFLFAIGYRTVDEKHRKITISPYQLPVFPSLSSHVFSFAMKKIRALGSRMGTWHRGFQTRIPPTNGQSQTGGAIAILKNMKGEDYPQYIMDNKIHVLTHQPAQNPQFSCGCFFGASELIDGSSFISLLAQWNPSFLAGELPTAMVKSPKIGDTMWGPQDS